MLFTLFFFFFFFKQKTAYEMRISDWSSDVCASDLLTPVAIREGQAFADTVFGGKPSTVSYDCIPSAVFSHPPLGGVGMTEAEARNRLGAVKVYTSDFRPMKNVLAERNEQIGRAHV